MHRTLAVIAALAAALTLHAQTLVRDINHSRIEHSYPRDFLSDGRTTYFFAQSDDGRELWKTDGTREGTRMVADLAPGPYSLNDARMGVISGGYLYFWAAAEDYAVNLWRTDGTASGTVQLTHREYYSGGDVVAFGAHGAVFIVDYAVYVTDGTLAGTKQIIDDAFFDPLDDFHQLVAFGGNVYFAENDALWRIDGSGAKTKVADEIGRDSHQAVVFDGVLYVVAGDRIWRSDGKPSATTFQRIPRLQVVGQTLYILTSDFEYTHVLRSDGTEVAKVTGEYEWSFNLIAATDDYLFFSTRSDAGETIWRSDGTLSGTVFVGIFPYVPSYAATHKALFVSAGFGLYVAGGDLRKISSNYFEELTAAGDNILCAGFEEQHGEEPWISNGTAAGTKMVMNIAADGGSFAGRLRRFGIDRALFGALDDDHGYEPWITDGTTDGTELLADANPGFDHSYAARFTDLGNGTAVFAAEEPFDGRELWVTDGTPVGTHIVRDLLRGKLGSLPDAITEFPVIDGRALFFAYPGLWKTDGTFAGTTQVKPLDGYVVSPVVARGEVYTAVANGFAKSNGTDEGTVILAENGQPLAAAGSNVFFISNDYDHGRELWITDGTPAGTHLVKDINPNGDGVGDDVSVAVGGTLYFFADDGVHGKELWRSDGTESGTVMVKDIAPGSLSSFVRAYPADQMMAAYHGLAYFVANDGLHGAELWRSDGMPEGTFMVRDVNPGAASSTPVPMTVMFDRLYFGADDGEHGREPWSTDGALVAMVSDLNPGPASSAPRDFVALKDSILFSATREDLGRELWKMAPLAGPPAKHRGVRP